MSQMQRFLLTYSAIAKQFFFKEKCSSKTTERTNHNRSWSEHLLGNHWVLRLLTYRVTLKNREGSCLPEDYVSPTYLRQRKSWSNVVKLTSSTKKKTNISTEDMTSCVNQVWRNKECQLSEENHRIGLKQESASADSGWISIQRLYLRV
jgi:hypothetical protein